jgi:glycosyltransferase involved in cell wall biosynthesis
VRLAWFSPLPPIPSGIADYSAEILPLVAEHAEVDVFTPRSNRRLFDSSSSLAVRDPRRFSRLAGGYDAVFYHLGNNPHHDFVYLAARERPGIAVFHDLVLHHLISYLFAEKKWDWEAYRAMLVEEYGETGEKLISLRRRGVFTGLEHFLYPLNGYVARRAQAIVVHSEDAREQIGAVAPLVPVTVIPHHAGSPPPGVRGITREEARRTLGLPEEAFIVGHFGFLTLPKQPAAVLRGFARLVERRPDALLLLVGQRQIHGMALDRLIRSLGLGQRVRMVGFVDLPTFYLHLKAADAVVNLRYPSAGEASGTFARALAEGRAVIANNVGSFASVPPDVVLVVEVDGDQEAQVGAHLIRLAEDPSLKRALEQHARGYASTLLEGRRCAQLYLGVARQAAERSPVALRESHR